MDDPVVILLAVLCIVTTAVAFFCAWDVRRRYQDYAGGRVWGMFTEANTRAVVAGLLMVSVIVYGLVGYAMGWSTIPRPWGAVVLAFGYLLHQWGPISRWIALYRIERGKP